MTKFTANNRMLLREYYPSLYQLIRNRERNRDSYNITVSRSGDPNLEIDGETTSTYMYSKYNPVQEVEIWMEKNRSSIDGVEHIFLYGFGLGYHIEQIIQLYPNSYIHVYEPQIEVFLAAIEARDLKPILKHKRIGVIGVGDDELIVTHFCINLASQITTSFHSLIPPYYLKNHEENISLFNKIFQSSIVSVRTNYATMKRFKNEWPENIILNMERTLKSRPIHALKNQLANYTAFVVGSGPSLNEDIRYLKECQDNSIILAAGSSVQALLKNGIYPHAIVSFDGSEKNYDVFKGLELEGIPFIFASYLKYKILEDFVREEDTYHLYISTDTITKYIFNLKDQSKQFQSTASVTGAVIQTAVYFGCKTIVLVGQDLSYSV